MPYYGKPNSVSFCVQCRNSVLAIVAYKGKGKGVCKLFMEIHLTTTECHLPYGITQCYGPRNFGGFTLRGTDIYTHYYYVTKNHGFTVSSPLNSQNEKVYSNASKKNIVDPHRLIHEHQHFSKSVMVSVGVSKMGKTKLAFVERGVIINSDYYCKNLLTHNLPRDI